MYLKLFQFPSLLLNIQIDYIGIGYLFTFNTIFKHFYTTNLDIDSNCISVIFSPKIIKNKDIGAECCFDKRKHDLTLKDLADQKTS